MRWIEKRSEPTELREWRLKNAGDINFGYDLMRSDQTVRAALLTQLLSEQGNLCAYTGRRIGESSCHMEHVKPQEYCTPDESVSYSNIVACFPEPNRSEKCPYGAEEKGDFPAPSETDLFVSPLSQTCESRFHYTYSGHIRSARESDAAATRTISELNLDHTELREMRRAEIRGTLAPRDKPLTLEKARRLSAILRQAPLADFRPFHFVLRQAVENNIRMVEKAAVVGATRKQK